MQKQPELPAQRTLLNERAQAGMISQAEAAAADRQTEQQVLAITRKYDALDAERARIGERPYWAVTFTRAMAAYTTREVAAGRVRLRLDDNATRDRQGRAPREPT